MREETILLKTKDANWLKNLFEKASPTNTTTKFSTIKKEYEDEIGNFELFWFSKEMEVVREMGLLVV